MRAAAITPEPIRWLEYPNIPLGKLTAVAGQMGQAKSLYTIYLAAEVSTGRLGDRAAGVVMFNAEDDAPDTIRPRLEAAGADLERVWIEPSITLTAELLGRACDELGDVALVTVDPIQAYMPGAVNSWKGQDVRAFLEPLRQFAAERRVAIVLVQHLNRRSDTGDALARIADSQGIPQLARSVLLWGPNPGDPEGDQGAQKVLTRAKGNLSRSTSSSTFTIVERELPGGIVAPALVRGADSQISADDLVADRETRTATEEAVEWLQNALEAGPLDAKDVMKRAREDGIAEKTLRRAKTKAGAISEQHRSAGHISRWVWLIPINDDDHVDHLGHVGHLDKVANVANKANVATLSEGSP